MHLEHESRGTEETRSATSRVGLLRTWPTLGLSVQQRPGLALCILKCGPRCQGTHAAVSALSSATLQWKPTPQGRCVCSGKPPTVPVTTAAAAEVSRVPRSEDSSSSEGLSVTRFPRRLKTREGGDDRPYSMCVFSEEQVQKRRDLAKSQEQENWGRLTCLRGKSRETLAITEARQGTARRHGP